MIRTWGANDMSGHVAVSVSKDEGLLLELPFLMEHIVI
jgi:hypothetical protein